MSRYIPVLRTKAGEAEALAQLTISARQKIFPLVNVAAAVPAGFVDTMTTHFIGSDMALDGSNSYASTGSLAAFISLFDRLGVAGISIIPSVSLISDPVYVAAIAPLVNRYAPGVLIQATISDLPAVAAWTIARGWNPNNCDLVVMAGGMADHNPRAFGSYIAHEINTNISQPLSWRSISLNSWSAPRDHGALPRGASLIPRNDWLLWTFVRPSVPFELDYSDYGHLHPSLEEVEGFVMANATVSVRYTIDNYWINIKGFATTGPNGQSMGDQYRSHARSLVADAHFNALAAGCWGDDRIRHYATTPHGTGGRSQWASVLLNRHLSFIADRIP